MRKSALLVVFMVLFLAGVFLAGVFYLPHRASTEPAPDSPALQPSLNATPTPQKSVPLNSNPNPDLTTDESGLSQATVHIITARGVIRFKFYPKDAPMTVNRIVELINQGFYNGLTFHRVVPRFVIQGGDPSGDGSGGSGMKLKAEFNRRRHIEGSVAMARASNPDSADSQFYITLEPAPHLDGQYTVFGMVIDGMDVVRRIQMGDRMEKVVLE